MVPGRNLECPRGRFRGVFVLVFYGSGASIELAEQSARTAISLRFSALAGAFLVGVAGAKWITNKVDKRLLKKGVRVAATKSLPQEQTENMMKGTPREVLQEIKDSCRSCA